MGMAKMSAKAATVFVECLMNEENGVNNVLQSGA